MQCGLHGDAVQEGTNMPHGGSHDGGGRVGRRSSRGEGVGATQLFYKMKCSDLKKIQIESSFFAEKILKN